MARLTSGERNQNNYVKYSDVSIETINKYKGKLPDELLNIWNITGYGIYENGSIQLVNLDDHDFVFKHIDKLLEPSIVFAITATGDLLIWEGNKNWTIASNEGNRVKTINVRKCISRALDSFRGAIDIFFDDFFIAYKDYFASKPYLDIKGKLPKSQYGQCYGYVPALVLGGKVSNKNLQVVDVKTYIDTIGQAVGKIIDLEE